ncbi:segregation and condensation protein A [Enteractinococcus coprophilus]|uniref:Segregation and condensation protein A n=1 Tax=Enteractinococcus coprophilus TaxID=1027633 RepID=A0A543AJV7_9MICC|nr:ScpA family protein [Enteractinococcus coprophilus]TQL72873.1 condensin subunit ScpA [Enteractinococcus coprophilus]
MSQLASPTFEEDYTEEHVGFELALTNFSGPFDLLLSLIARRRMDVTEVALAEVTDEFLAYVATLETTEEVLENSTSFMVVAATLLELKTARLLPSGIGDTTEEMALLEERDLLFARLLQYRAFKQAADLIKDRIRLQSAMLPRQGGPEPQHAKLLPELVFDLSAHDFAAVAQELFTRFVTEPTEVGTQHLHAPVVSLTEQVAIMSRRIQEAGQLTFSGLTSDASNSMTVVVRFLGLLTMYRDQLITWHQDAPLSEITVFWHEAP